MIEIEGKRIGPGHPPYLVAEISGNHNGKKSSAIELINAAKDSGADAIKLQTFTPDCLTFDSNNTDFIVHSGPWAGQSLYSIYKNTMTPFEWYNDLFEHAKRIGITIFSSPFSRMSLDFLDIYDPPAYKIASNELHDYFLLQSVAERQKPLFLSTGASTFQNIIDAVDLVHSCDNKNVVVLYCVSKYPTDISDANLATLMYLKEHLNVSVGLSDHSLSHTVVKTATAMGASVIEKHFTLNRDGGGPDDSFSLEPHEFLEMRQICDEITLAIGQINFPDMTELQSRSIFTRQLWSKKKIEKGETIDWSNISSIRAPAMSGAVSAKNYKGIIGTSARVTIDKHMPIFLNEVQ